MTTSATGDSTSVNSNSTSADGNSTSADGNSTSANGKSTSANGNSTSANGDSTSAKVLINVVWFFLNADRDPQLTKGKRKVKSERGAPPPPDKIK